MGFLGSFLKVNTGAIGVDLGSSSLKLAQISPDSGGDNAQVRAQLIAAAGAEIPQEVRADPKARIEFFKDTVSDLLSQGGFKGRKAVLGLPASCMHLERLRVPVLPDEQTTKQAIQYELVERLPFHPSRAMIRHFHAGEIYEDNEKRNEVIVMATRREFTDCFLAAASKAKIEVVGVNAEPIAIANCLAPVDNSPQPAARAYIDIGSAGTRVYIAAGRKIQFARAVPVGTEQLDLAVAHAFHVPLPQARELRFRMATQRIAEHPEGNAPAAAAGTAATATLDPAAEAKQREMVRVEQACIPALRKLVEELELCLRYHHATFPGTPLEQLIFVGGAASQRRLCRKIASELHVAAHAADPLSRVTPTDSISPDLFGPNTP
ncbi:MAG TPA: pilus assembly protein PilM, partial [Tepidisphaeraceae bacterium]